jgi:hypothetical protein
VESWAIGLGYIGWVTDYDIVGFLGESREKIRLEKGDAVGYVVDFGVGLGNLKRFARKIDSNDFGSWQMNRESDSYGS